MDLHVIMIGLCCALTALATGRSIAQTEKAPGRTLHVSQNALLDIVHEAQFRTIGDAAKVVEPGDTVVIHGGIYRESVVIEKSGTKDEPIHFTAAEGELVTVNGADKLTKWEKADPRREIYSIEWPYRLDDRSEEVADPQSKEYLQQFRCEQVFADGYPLHQVFQRDQLSIGSFFADLDAKRLYVWRFDNHSVNWEFAGRIEASVRQTLWDCKGDFVSVRGIRFLYAANRAQHGMAEFSGNNDVVEDCIFEESNGSGASFTGQNIVVRRCQFLNHGQLGFDAEDAHNLLVTDCLVRNNNTKGFDTGWEAGGNKICMSRGVVIENSTFVDNRGPGVWFDTGNEDCTVRNCLVADNEDGGIFYEVSYGLHAHDNVVIGNGFAEMEGNFGVASGICLSNSPNCVIERNLILANRDGFDFRDQTRGSLHIGDPDPYVRKKHYPIWSHDEIIRNNVLAYNVYAQTWAWWDIEDERHWPAAIQPNPIKEAPRGADDESQMIPPPGLTLEKLNLTFQNNLYFPAPGQELIHWGAPWKSNKSYDSLAAVQSELQLEKGSQMLQPDFADFQNRDLRVPADSLLLKLGCYPRGDVPGVRLGVLQ